MYALKGYIDNNTIVVDENIDVYEGCNVIITVLDPIEDEPMLLQYRYSNDESIKAAEGLSGIWSDYDSVSVEETVRNMRKGRHFDF
ncbi:MAG: hypothetical protein II969_04755 [Anaerolineaceae bacterium]|nr:hypothetical protein [Anaerolineaceae bacterium]